MISCFRQLTLHFLPYLTRAIMINRPVRVIFRDLVPLQLFHSRNRSPTRSIGQISFQTGARPPKSFNFLQQYNSKHQFIWWMRRRDRRRLPLGLRIVRWSRTRSLRQISSKSCQMVSIGVGCSKIALYVFATRSDNYIYIRHLSFFIL